MFFVHSVPYAIKIEKSLEVTGYDGILFISAGKPGAVGPEPLSSAIAKALKVSWNFTLIKIRIITDCIIEIVVVLYLIEIIPLISERLTSWLKAKELF